MLISQIEHARLSAELAAHCRGVFAEPSAHRDEVIAAILHHDDGWAEWERAPRLDPQLARPLSFTELEPAEATAIWTGSIGVAAAIGPLADSMVSGHFLRLLDKSDHFSHDASCAQWRRQMADRREAWIAEWMSLDLGENTRADAAQALEWLWIFDEISLWFCTSCPAIDEPGRTIGGPYHVGLGTPLHMELEASLHSLGAAAASPWRFDVDFLDLAVACQTVPVERYRSSQEMLAAARPGRLAWRFGREI